MSSGGSFAAVLADLGAVLDRLAGCATATATDVAIVEALTAAEAAAVRLDAQRLRLLGVFDARGLAAVRGATSTTVWLRHTTGMATSTASRRVRVARAVAGLPAFTAAMTAGEVGFDHARVVATLARDLPREVLVEADGALAEIAREVDADTMRGQTAHLQHSLDPEPLVDAAARQHARRRLHVSPTFDGMVAIDGLLDPTSGAAVMAALDPLTMPSGPDDERSAAQRRADALTELARTALDGGGLPSRGGHKPHLSVLVDVTTLCGTPGARGGQLAGVGVIPGETARRLGCDALLTTITLNGQDILDVGRTQRLVNDKLRQALAVRDGGCVFPGCQRPSAWCDAHHLIHWARGGKTSLANTALLCRWHHTYLHEGRWTLHRHPDGAWTATNPHGEQRHRPAKATLAPP